MTLKVMLVAAEASGDSLGAGLARALKARMGGQVTFVGVGGAKMAEEGVRSPFDIAELSILGLTEGLKAWPRVRRRAREAAEIAAREQPDVAVLIDSWGFTLRVAHRLRAQDTKLPLVKYVGPQVWASRPGRAKTLAETVDLLLTLHTFDAPLFEAAGLKTVVVGNPALNRDLTGVDGGRFRAEIGATEGEPILLLAPGSRPSEIARVLPVFADAAGRLVAERPGLKVVIPLAATVASLVRGQAAGWAFPVILVDDEARKADAMAAATVALACSGTVTTELALTGCPMVVGYRIGPLTYAILKRIVRTRWITLFNIAAGREIAPELIQDALTGEALVREAAARLDDPVLRASQISAQYEALEKMGRGGGDPAERAADAVLALLQVPSPVTGNRQQKSPGSLRGLS